MTQSKLCVVFPLRQLDYFPVAHIHLNRIHVTEANQELEHLTAVQIKDSVFCKLEANFVLASNPASAPASPKNRNNNGRDCEPIYKSRRRRVSIGRFVPTVRVVQLPPQAAIVFRRWRRRRLPPTIRETDRTDSQTIGWCAMSILLGAE